MNVYKTFFYKEINKEDWNFYWDKIKFSNLLQSWEYGDSKKNLFCKPIRYLITNEIKEPIAIVQILIYGIPLFPCLARINRGPLLLDPEESEEKFHLNIRIIKLIEYILRKKNCIFLLISPETLFKEYKYKIFFENGFKLKNKNSWSSSRLFLRKNEEEIFKSLKAKWRNMLRKSLKSELVIMYEDINELTVNKLIKDYKDFKNKKGFNGISSNLISKLIKTNSPNWKCNVYRSYKTKKDKLQLTGMLVAIFHSKTATYLLAYSNNIGRSLNSNYLLLWRSIIDAKKLGCDWYDMGGMNPNTPEGIAHFKKGVNGEFYSNISNFYKILF